MTTTKSQTKHNIVFESNPFKSCFSGLDRLFQHNLRPAIAILMVGALFGMPGFVNSFATGKNTQTATPATAPDLSAGVIVAIIVGVLVAIIIFTAVSTIFSGVMNYVVYKTMKGERTTIKEALAATMNKFWTILAIHILVGLKVLGGIILFIIPGIRAGLRYQMTLLPMFDEDLKARAAMRRIKDLTKDHLLEIFGIVSVAALIFPINSLVQMGGESVMYHQLKSLKASGAPKPPVHWLNYIGFIMLAGFMAFVAFIVLLVVLIRMG
jgi:hypothetical protein